MPLIERSALPTNISIKGLIYSALLLLLVISLFFIPEIIRFQEKISKAKQVASFGASTSASGSDENDVDIDSLLSSSKSGRSLDSILSMVEKGGSDTATETGSTDLTLGAPKTGNNSALQSIQDRVLLEKTFGGGSVTWEQLNSAEVKKAFKNAQTEASKLLKNLPARQTAIRFALINYINGLGWMTRADHKLMSAEEALAYIEQLDINVSQAMLISEIDAGDFETWKKISFGPLSANSRASAFKTGTYIAFNPRLTLTDVAIFKSPDYTKQGASWAYNRHQRSSVKLSGFVLGRDTRKITVLKNGRRYGEIRLAGRPNDDGLRAFNYRIRDGYGFYTLRAYSKGGQAFEKTYVFVPKVAGRFKQDDEGYFILPFATADADSVNLQSIDMRLDRFFRVGRTQNSAESENRGFDTF